MRLQGPTNLPAHLSGYAQRRNGWHYSVFQTQIAHIMPIYRTREGLRRTNRRTSSVETTARLACFANASKSRATTSACATTVSYVTLDSIRRVFSQNEEASVPMKPDRHCARAAFTGLEIGKPALDPATVRNSVSNRTPPLYFDGKYLLHRIFSLQ